jgi:geranylgeranyl reductase family protein
VTTEGTAGRQDPEVLIVGAGPAGTAAAVTLARAGRRVLVVDKASFPRDKCCGDGLTTGALRILEELGLDPTDVPSWTPVDEVWLRSPSGREVELRLPDRATMGQFSAVAPRRELDAALVALARRAGADILEGVALESISLTTERAEIGLSDGTTVHASFVIAADGMWSPTRKLLGLHREGYLGEWHAFRQYIGGVTGPAASRQYVWFDKDILPGYAWSFPLPPGPDGRVVVNFGFGVPRDGRRIPDMKSTWNDLLARPHIVEALGPDLTPLDRPTAWPIPARIDEAVLSHGRTLFVGDAAGATDVMTGEGIGQALLTGVLAGRAIVERSGDPERAVDAVTRAYRTAVRHHLFADHRMSKALGRVLRHGWGARGAVRVVALTDWTRRNFVRWMFEDEPRAVVFTPRRWHRHFLTRAGAYRGRSNTD